jgi:hypothetical protein
MRTRHFAVIPLTALLLAAAAPLGAQQRAAGPARPVNPLETAKRLRCTFVVSAHGSWAKGEPLAQTKSGGMLTQEFYDINPQESMAVVKGAAQTSEIVAQLRGWNLHLLDVRSTGALIVTTVFGQESREGKLKAAYTRADYLPVEIPGFASSPEVSQHYGECEIVPVP